MQFCGGNNTANIYIGPQQVILVMEIAVRDFGESEAINMKLFGMRFQGMISSRKEVSVSSFL